MTDSHEMVQEDDEETLVGSSSEDGGDGHSVKAKALSDSRSKDVEDGRFPKAKTLLERSIEDGGDGHSAEAKTLSKSGSEEDGDDDHSVKDFQTHDTHVLTKEEAIILDDLVPPLLSLSLPTNPADRVVWKLDEKVVAGMSSGDDEQGDVTLWEKSDSPTSSMDQTTREEALDTDKGDADHASPLREYGAGDDDDDDDDDEDHMSYTAASPYANDEEKERVEEFAREAGLTVEEVFNGADPSILISLATYRAAGDAELD